MALNKKLKSDFIKSMARALIDHKDGKHVGTNSDETNCGACMYGGDMDGLGNQDRGELLERNVADQVALMRLRATMNKLEFSTI